MSLRVGPPAGRDGEAVGKHFTAHMGVLSSSGDLIGIVTILVRHRERMHQCDPLSIRHQNLSRRGPQRSCQGNSSGRHVLWMERSSSQDKPHDSDGMLVVGRFLEDFPP